MRKQSKARKSKDPSDREINQRILSDWDGMMPVKFATALARVRTETDATLTKAFLLPSPQRLTMLSYNAAFCAGRVDDALDQISGLRAHHQGNDPASAQSALAGGMHFSKDLTAMGTYWFAVGVWLREVVRLDSWCRAAENLRRKCEADRVIDALWSASVCDPPFDWVGMSGRADEVALNFAISRRANVIHGLAMPFRQIRGDKEYEAKPDERKAEATLLDTDIFDHADVVPLDIKALLLRCLHVGGIERTFKPTTLDIDQRLRASCNRLVAHLDRQGSVRPKAGRFARASPEQSPVSRRPVLVFVQNERVISLDGERFKLSQEQFDLVKTIADGRGDWVPSRLLTKYFLRVDRAVKRLPESLRNVIDRAHGKAKGYRIPVRLLE